MIWLRHSFPTRAEPILTPVCPLAVFSYRWVAHSSSPQLTTAVAFSSNLFSITSFRQIWMITTSFFTFLSAAKSVSKCSKCINSRSCNIPMKASAVSGEGQGSPNPVLLCPAQIHGHGQISPQWEGQVLVPQSHPGVSSAESRGSAHLLTKSLLLQGQQGSGSSSCPSWALWGADCSQHKGCSHRLGHTLPSIPGTSPPL